VVEMNGKKIDIGRLSTVDNETLRKIRLEIAVKICMTYPDLYRKIVSHSDIFKDDKEREAYRVLEELLKCDATLKYTISYYYKREKW
jgi:hypothetical protein